MIILRLLLLLTNLHLKLLSTQGTGADKLLSTQRVKGTCRYQLAMLLNEISLSDNSLGQLKIVTTNVQLMTLFGLKRIVKSCLVQNYSYYCAIPNCYVCQLYVN